MNASQTLTLVCGGAYIKISEGNIELGCPGNIFLKATNIQKMGAVNLNQPAQELPSGFKGGFDVTDKETGKPLPYTLYKITTAEGEVYSGTTNKEGKTMPIYTAVPSSIKIEFPFSNTDSEQD